MDDEGAAGEASPRPLEAWQRLLAGALGVVLLGAGVVAVFVSDNQFGSAFLLVAGVLLLLIGVLELVPDRFRIGDNEVSWQRTAQRLRETGLTPTPVGPDAGGQSTVLARLRELEIGYEYLRSSLPRGGQRTVALEEVLLKARGVSAVVSDAQLQARLATFAVDAPGARVITLALLEARRPADPDAALPVLTGCLETSRSDFEEYHGLLAARETAGSLSQAAGAELRTAVENYLRRAKDASGERPAMAREVLQRL